jgi:hypothetical protein
MQVNEAAVQGLGIANAPLWQVRSLVDRGIIELLLTRFEPPPVLIHAVWLAARLLPAKTGIFVDFLAATSKASGYYSYRKVVFLLSKLTIGSHCSRGGPEDRAVMDALRQLGSRLVSDDRGDAARA